MSGALVRAVAPVHVPLPRRGVLRGWLAGIGATASRIVRIRVPGPRRRALGARRSAPDAVEAGMKFSALRSTVGWLEERTGIGGAVTPVLEHPVPRSTASWWYVFGSAT